MHERCSVGLGCEQVGQAFAQAGGSGFRGIEDEVGGNFPGIEGVAGRR